MRIDSKGRISIPADIRRSLGLNGEVLMDFDLEEGIVFLYGRCSVAVSIGACGALDVGSNPASDPKKDDDLNNRTKSSSFGGDENGKG